MQDVLLEIVYFFGKGFCHQLAERSFEAGGVLFGVCARCTGIYLGFAATLTIFVLATTFLSQNKAPQLRISLWLGVILIVPLAIDGTCSYLGLYATTSPLRYTTGYLCGMGLALIAGKGVAQVSANCSEKPKTAWAAGAAVFAASALVGILFYVGHPFLGAGAPIVIALCLWLAVAMVVFLIVSSTKLWQKANSRVCRSIVIAGCLVAAIAVMTASSIFTSVLTTGLNVLML